MDKPQMMPSEPVSPNLYFLHIPKTAGTSLRFWLSECFSEGDWLPCHILDEVQRVPRQEINRYRFFSGHFAFKIFDYLDQEPLTVTWLREPLAREISQYNFTREQFVKLRDIALENGRDEWIRHYDRVRDMSLPKVCQSNSYLGFNDNLQTRYLSGSFPAEGAVPCDRAMLDRAKSGLLRLFHFGLCEQMDPSIDLLCYRLGHPRRELNLSFNRREGERKRTQELTPAERKVVLEANRFDVELYEFAKYEFERRLEEFWRLVDPTVTGASVNEIFDAYDNRNNAEPIEDFLKRNFQNKHADTTLTKTRHARVDFREAAFIQGWYPRWEVQPGEFARWAGPRVKSSVFVPLDPTCDYEIHFRIRNCPDFQAVKNLRIQVGNHSIPLNWERVTSPCGRFHHIEMTGRIPTDAISRSEPYTEVVFVSESTFEQQVKFDKTRFVSFATDKIEIKAA